MLSDKINYKWVLIIVLFWVITSDAFNSNLLIDFGSSINKVAKAFVFIWMTLYLFINYSKITTVNSNFYKIINIFVAIPFMSSIPCFLYHEQSIMVSLFGTFFNFTTLLLFYYVLHIKQVNEKTIVAAIVCTGIIIAVIMIWQQLFPDNAYFGVPTKEEILQGQVIEKRNGLFRFRIRGIDFAMLACFLCWSKLMKRFKLSIFIFGCIFFIAIYLSLTRQILFASLFAILISFYLNQESSSKFSKYIVFIIIIGALVYFGDSMFGEMIKDVRLNVDDSGYVRYLSYAKFWNDSFTSIMTFFLGNGYPFGDSPYNQYIFNLGLNGLYPSDVGFVGEGYHFGYIFIISYYVMVYRLIFNYRKIIPLYILMYIIAMSICSVMLLPISKMGVWAFLLYICDLHINTNKQKVC